MTATFFRRGEGRSRNASRAEAEGRMPLSRAKLAVAKHLGCTQAVAAAALKFLHDGEWHHVGKYAMECAYYDTEDYRLAGVIRQVAAYGGPRKFAAAIKAKRRTRHDRAYVYVRYSRADRFAESAARRRRVRATVEAAGLGAASHYPINLESTLVSLAGSAYPKDTIPAGRANGWTDQQIAIVLAEHGYRAEEIRARLAQR